MKSMFLIDFPMLNSQRLWITRSERKSSPTSAFYVAQHVKHVRVGKNTL
jgi:hypothetical protein